MTHFPIEALRSVDLVVPDLAAAEAFYTEVWGLTLAAREKATIWLRGSGTDAHILALHSGSTPVIRSMTFRAEPGAYLDQIAGARAAAGA